MPDWTQISTLGFVVPFKLAFEWGHRSHINVISCNGSLRNISVQNLWTGPIPLMAHPDSHFIIYVYYQRKSDAGCLKQLLQVFCHFLFYASIFIQLTLWLCFSSSVFSASLFLSPVLCLSISPSSRLPSSSELIIYLYLSLPLSHFISLTLISCAHIHSLTTEAPFGDYYLFQLLGLILIELHVMCKPELAFNIDLLSVFMCLNVSMFGMFFLFLLDREDLFVQFVRSTSGNYSLSLILLLSFET